ncbi:SDR family NAD(P)-dependent oxidoreductase [Alteromonas sp. H39]|uniref:SDR family NAD(P)-dependent oxidoreductase n=1 Tax=Alteromonas sp. H39 TaxID=3389876 RepID=UPI0039E0F718
MSEVSLIIGASGGIGRELVSQLADNDNDVIAVSRSGFTDDNWPDNVTSVACDSHDESQIENVVKQLSSDGQTVRMAVCTVGMLHGEVDGINVQPEKQLESLNEKQLSAYFSVNTIIPSLWVKHLVGVMSNNALLVCVSARVGSISDNRLGGWYGYRASKAALNMMIKTAAIEYGRRAKGTALVCYHPGTVDTALSEPFQGNVKPEKLFTPEFTVSQLLKITRDLDPKEGPYYLDWDGEPINW